jgi:hypothetical protein
MANHRRNSANINGHAAAPPSRLMKSRLIESHSLFPRARAGLQDIGPGGMFTSTHCIG